MSKLGDCRLSVPIRSEAGAFRCDKKNVNGMTTLLRTTTTSDDVIRHVDGIHSSEFGGVSNVF